MLDWITLERGVLFVAVLSAFGFGVWIGEDEKVEPNTKVVHRETVFSRQDQLFEPVGKLVLWETPDSSETRKAEVTIPDFFPELSKPNDTVYIDKGVGPNLPSYSVTSLAEGVPIHFEDGQAVLQTADPRTGRMMEIGVDMPEDTWRGYVDLTSLAGKDVFFSSAVFEVARKVDFGVIGLGAGGAAMVVKDQAAAGFVGRISYRKKLF